MALTFLLFFLGGLLIVKSWNYWTEKNSTRQWKCIFFLALQIFSVEKGLFMSDENKFNLFSTSYQQLVNWFLKCAHFCFAAYLFSTSFHNFWKQPEILIRFLWNKRLMSIFFLRHPWRKKNKEKLFALWAFLFRITSMFSFFLLKKSQKIDENDDFHDFCLLFLNEERLCCLRRVLHLVLFLE